MLHLDFYIEINIHNCVFPGLNLIYQDVNEKPPSSMTVHFKQVLSGRDVLWARQHVKICLTENRTKVTFLLIKTKGLLITEL